MYEAALVTAKQTGQSSKARRCDRALKSITAMAQQLKAGKKVNLDDLPPEVSTGGGGGSQVAQEVPQAASRRVESQSGKQELVLQMQ